MEITQNLMEKALAYLAETDVEYADAKGLLEELAISCKRMRQRAFTLATGTVAERNALAEDTPGVVKADCEWISQVRAFEVLKQKRARAVLTIDIWRSLNASRRQGNIT